MHGGGSGGGDGGRWWWWLPSSNEWNYILCMNWWQLPCETCTSGGVYSMFCCIHMTIPIQIVTWTVCGGWLIGTVVVVVVVWIHR